VNFLHGAPPQTSTPLLWTTSVVHDETSPDLLCDCVSDNLPFTHTGIDFAGPLYMWTQGSEEVEHKAYICLFTCASTRAIHLELMRSLNVDQFLLAFHCFVGRRGLPSTLWSDNAKTFESSAKDLLCVPQKFLIICPIEKLCGSSLSTEPPDFWERMEQSVKRSL